ncbi:MAG: hypothetical protein V2J51_14235 [Erythrobacter sp.]|jgi:hypothetical protein|nr:hypothetical protein [Erythrobacter sp.]
MSDICAEMEVLENRLMRGWMGRNVREIKALVATDCLFMFGTRPPTLLDRPSFVAAIDRGFVCEAFRFGAVTARQHRHAAWFTGDIELEMRLSRREWRGRFLLTDLWTKSRLKRRWKLAERSLAPLDGDEDLSAAIHALQLWR